MSVHLQIKEFRKKSVSQDKSQKLNGFSKKKPISVPGRSIKKSVIISQGYLTSISRRRDKVQLPAVVRQAQVVINKQFCEEEQIAKIKKQIEKDKKYQKETEDEIYSINREDEKFRQEMVEIHKRKRELQNKKRILTQKRQSSEDVQERINLKMQIEEIEDLIMMAESEQGYLQGYISHNRNKLSTLLMWQGALESQIKSLYENLIRLQDIIRNSPQKPIK